MRLILVLLGCALLAGPASAQTVPGGTPPSPPAIPPGARAFPLFAGRPAQVIITWPAGPNIARYRARWLQAGTQIDIELAGTATLFEREVRAPGRYELTLVAIDRAGLESTPTVTEVNVVTVDAIPPGATEPATPRVPAFAVGTRFRAAGLVCRLGDGPVSRDAAAREAGPTTLRCGPPGGAAGPRVEVPIVIAPVLIDGPKEPILRGAETKVHLTVASVAQLGDRLEVTAARGDAKIGAVSRTPHGLEVAVTPGGTAPTAALMVQGSGHAVGTVELPIVDPPPPPPPAVPVPAWFALDVGYHLAVIVPTADRPQLGDSNREVAPRPLGGGRLGFFPVRRWGIEAELAIGSPDFRPKQSPWLVSTRAQVVARPVDGRFGLQLVGGAGFLNASGVVHYGGALTFETSDNLWLHVQVLHAIAPGRDDYAHCVEMQLGVVTRLGRRDRIR